MLSILQPHRTTNSYKVSNLLSPPISLSPSPSCKDRLLKVIALAQPPCNQSFWMSAKVSTVVVSTNWMIMILIRDRLTWLALSELSLLQVLSEPPWFTQYQIHYQLVSIIIRQQTVRKSAVNQGICPSTLHIAPLGSFRSTSYYQF